MCAWGLADFCAGLDNAGRYMTADEVARVRFAGRKYLDAYAYLAREASQEFLKSLLRIPPTLLPSHLLFP